MKITLDYVECPFCGEIREFKDEWTRCDVCNGVYRVRPVAEGGRVRYEIAGIYDLSDDEARLMPARLREPYSLIF